MKRQPATGRTRGATSVVRVLLWLAAAFSLADLTPAFAESFRFGKFHAGVIDTQVVSASTRLSIASPEAILVSDDDDDDAVVPGLFGNDPALDGFDHAAALITLAPRGKASGPVGIVAAQCPDGQRLSAFRSRAPPATA